MYKCKRCDSEFIDGVQCSVCQGRYDFPCAGITEGGYRKLGDRRNYWKCLSCKSTGTASPLVAHSSKTGMPKSPTPTDLESIALDVKQLSNQMSSLPALIESVKAIQSDISDLKTLKMDIAELKPLKTDVADMKTSLEFVHDAVETLTARISGIDGQIKDLLKTKDDVQHLQQRIEHLEAATRNLEQCARMNNIEIKGVPQTNSENLFEIVSKIGDHIKYPIMKDHINYVARIPMRNDKNNKSIIVSLHNRYTKEDIVAASKKCTITSAALGLRGDTRIYVNDHLTLENKVLLNKVKAFAKERNFAFTWVKGCKIFIRKNTTTPVFNIKSESDLKRLVK